jgi:hypothetical protein
LALVLVFLVLVLALVFLPDLHPHVLHILSPFKWGLESHVGPRHLPPGDSMYLSAAKTAINQHFSAGVVPLERS